MPEAMLPEFYDPNEVLSMQAYETWEIDDDPYSDDRYRRAYQSLIKGGNRALLSFFGSSLFQNKYQDGNQNPFFDHELADFVFSVTDGKFAKLSQKKKRYAVARVIVHLYEMVYIKSGGRDTVYARDSRKKQLVMSAMSTRDLEVIARDVYEATGCEDYDADDIKKTVETTKKFTVEQYQEVPCDYIMITDDIVYDVEAGEPMRANEISFTRPKIYYKLFDSTEQTRSIALVPPFTREESDDMMRLYEYDLDILEHPDTKSVTPGNYDRDTIPPEIFVWANGNLGVANDMMRALASPLLKNKPLGAFFLIGSTRNGKSTFINLINTMYGDRNVANVRLSQLADPHYSLGLANKLVNAVDEEEEGITKYQADYKVMADHGKLDLTVLYSQDPMKVNCRFMSFFPCNHIPEWGGVGKGACGKRTLAIPFKADLSKYDSKGENFVHKTYTKSFFKVLLPRLLALATYYSHNEYQISPKMRGYQKAVNAENNPSSAYIEHFETWFDGFQSWSLLHSDYVAWCKMHDYKWEDMSTLKGTFNNYIGSSEGDKKEDKRKTITVANGRKVKCLYREAAKGGTNMYLHEYLSSTDEHGPRMLKELNAAGISIVGRKDEAKEANESS